MSSSDYSDLSIANAAVWRRPKSEVMSRLFFWFCSIAFVFALHFAHVSYLYPDLEFWGFPYYPLGALEWLFLIVATASASFVLPLVLNRPSALVLFVLYLLVYLPSITITLATKPEALSSYGCELAALVLGFVCVAIGTRALVPSLRGVTQFVTLGGSAQVFLFLVCLALFCFILFSFRDAISFVGLDNIYEQRAAGKSRDMLEAYAQTYLAFVFSPAVFAVGLLRRKFAYFVLGLAGFVLMFSVTAERTIFLFPFAMTILYFVMRLRLGSSTVVGWATLSLAVTVAIVVYLKDTSLIFELLALYLVFRVIAIPGSMTWQYSDVFSGFGHTYWSNVTGVNLIVDVPTAFINAPNWPQLGYLVASDILHVESNSNAHLFAYDGIAAAGAIGVLVASGVLGVWLVVLDRAARFVDPIFVVLISFPMAFSLTNGSVFSLMLSFGGFFWIAFFAIAARGKRLGS